LRQAQWDNGPSSLYEESRESNTLFSPYSSESQSRFISASDGSESILVEPMFRGTSQVKATYIHPNPAIFTNPNKEKIEPAQQILDEFLFPSLEYISVNFVRSIDV
jgi:hypothetical protein